jgi:hypothetical protein
MPFCVRATLALCDFSRQCRLPRRLDPRRRGRRLRVGGVSGSSDDVLPTQAGAPGECYMDSKSATVRLRTGSGLTPSCCATLSRHHTFGSQRARSNVLATPKRTRTTNLIPARIFVIKPSPRLHGACTDGMCSPLAHAQPTLMSPGLRVFARVRSSSLSHNRAPPVPSLVNQTFWMRQPCQPSCLHSRM